MGDRACDLAFCPACDGQVAPDDIICPDCGADLPDDLHRGLRSA